MADPERDLLEEQEQNQKQFNRTLLRIVEREVQERFRDPVEIKETTVLKEGGERECIIVGPSKDGRIGVCIYPEDAFLAYQDGISAEEFVNDRLDAFAAMEKNGIGLPELSRNYAEKHLYAKLINRSGNQALLSTIPHQDVKDDLSIIARVRVDDHSSFLVTDELLPRLQMTKEEILEKACQNTEQMEYRCQTMREVMIEQFGMSEDQVPQPDNGFSPWVLTNKAAADGAYALVSPKAMELAYRTLGENFHVLPSSVHELILVPDSAGISARFLQEMVRSVNEQTVEPKERLSDSVYHYDGKEKKLKTAISWIKGREVEAAEKTVQAGKELRESMQGAAENSISRGR